jgi:hypothetical protein
MTIEENVSIVEPEQFFIHYNILQTLQCITYVIVALFLNKDNILEVKIH